MAGNARVVQMPSPLKGEPTLTKKNVPQHRERRACGNIAGGRASEKKSERGRILKGEGGNFKPCCAWVYKFKKKKGARQISRTLLQGTTLHLCAKKGGLKDVFDGKKKSGNTSILITGLIEEL